MFTALRSTSLTLAQFLRTQLATLLNGGDIFLHAPGQSEGATGVSLWLYRVTRDEALLNTAPARLNATTLRRTPLPLRLHYLVTPDMGTAAGAVETEQALLGRVMQLFHDAPQLRGSVLQDDFRDSSVELTIRLETLTTDELTRLFQSLSSPLHLGIAYEVSVVFVESEREMTLAPVETTVPQVGLLVGAGSAN